MPRRAVFGWPQGRSDTLAVSSQELREWVMKAELITLPQTDGSY